MPYKPIDIGAINDRALRQMVAGENILNARAQRDPNSLQNQLLAERLKQAQNPTASGKYGLNPVLMRNPQTGEIKAFQTYSGGGMQEIEIPKGFGPATKGSWKDTGGGFQFFEPYGPANPAPPAASGDPGINQYPEGAAPLPLQKERESAAAGGVTGYVPKGIPPEKTPGHAREIESVKQQEQTKAAADRKKNEMLGASAAKKAEAGFASVDKIKTNIFNLNDALAAIDAGADTGPIQQYLPTVRSASVDLQNVRSRLGLDVVGAVTFGALSKGELDLALNTALPTSKHPDALRKWIEDKVDAQTKLMNYLEEQSIFLSQPGNTQAMWAELTKTRKADPRISGGEIANPTPEQYKTLPDGASYTWDGVPHIKGQ